MTDAIEVFVGVTCPNMRIHPAILAQAAATTAAIFDKRFVWGVGSGENLNEHVVGLGWPEVAIRHEMMKEAIEIIRELWSGENISYYGTYFTVEDARIYTLPQQLPPIVISAYGPKAAKIAGQMGDGLITTSPDKIVVQTFEKSGGKGKSMYAQINVCVAEDADSALNTVMKVWPLEGFKGQMNSELRIPKYFEQLAQMVKPEDIQGKVPMGQDTGAIVEQVKKFTDMGFDHVYIHQIGQDQEAFFKLWQSEIEPELRKVGKEGRQK